MPVQTMSDAVASLQESVKHIDDLADEVRSANVSNKRLRIIVVILAVVLVAGGVFTGYTLHRFNETRETACQNRNQSARVTRVFAEQQFDIFEDATQRRDATQDQLALLEQLRRAVPQRDDTEIDCNDDDQVDAADYPDR